MTPKIISCEGGTRSVRLFAQTEHSRGNIVTLNREIMK